MDSALLGIYATLKQGFHKPCADPAKLYADTKDYPTLKKAEKILQVCKEQGIAVHPTKRKDLPPVLYLKGDIAFSQKIVGVCGPSRLDDSAKTALCAAVKTAQGLGCTIISGTLGDSEALTHTCGDNTVALLNDGNFEPFKRAISEFYPGVPPLKPYFNYKNELLCLLCDIIIYTKEEKGSRSLYTRDFANTLNKKVITLIEDDTFVLPVPPDGLTPDEAAVYSAFSQKIQDYDLIKIKTGLDDSALSMALFSLEVKGVLAQLPLSRYEMIL